MLKRMLVLLLSLLMAMGTLGMAVAEDAKPDPLGKYEPAIEIHAAIYSVGSARFPEGDSLDNNVFTRAYEEELGIKLVYDWTADYGGYSSDSPYHQKMNISIASGQIPEMFFVNSKQLKLLVEEGQLADLTGVIEEYASDDFMDYLYGDDGMAVESATFQEGIYGIPLTSAGLFWEEALWVRTDWLENLGIAVPEEMTVEDILEISRAFTEDDPDQNGKDDTFGFGLQKTFAGGMGNLPGFLNMYGAFDMYMRNDEGELYYGGVDDTVKRPLLKLQEMYAAGQIDPEFATKDLNLLAEDIVNGKIGLMYGAWWDPYWPFLDGVRRDENMTWKSYPVPSVDGGLAMNHTWFPVQGYFVVSKDCANPEALIKLFNYYQSRWTLEYYDPSYFEFTDTDGTVVTMAHHAFVRTDSSDLQMLEAFRAQSEAMTTGDLSQILLPADKNNVELAIAYRDTGDLTGYAQYMTINPDDGVWKVFDTYKTQGLNQPLIVYENVTPTMELKGTMLGELKDEVYTKIIMGAPIEEFDAFVAQWKELGGEQIIQELNEWDKERQ